MRVLCVPYVNDFHIDSCIYRLKFVHFLANVALGKTLFMTLTIDLLSYFCFLPKHFLAQHNVNSLKYLNDLFVEWNPILHANIVEGLVFKSGIIFLS